MAPYISLNGDGRTLHPQVLCAGQPTANSLLDADTGQTQFVRTQLLQISHLSSSEKDLVFAKLILVLVLGTKIEMLLLIKDKFAMNNNYKNSDKPLLVFPPNFCKSVFHHQECLCVSWGRGNGWRIRDKSTCHIESVNTMSRGIKFYKHVN